MRASKKDLPKLMETGHSVISGAEWGDMMVGYYTYSKESDLTPSLKGLPSDMCPCHHWGYVIKGQMTTKDKGHEEIAKAGDVYYVAPGHTTIFAEGTEILDFSPKEEFRKLTEAVKRNSAAAQKKK